MLDLEGRAAMAMARRGPEVHPNPPTQRSNGRLGYQDGAPVSVQLLLMAKAPVAGRVKTRLCPPATPVQAARVAAAALADTIGVLSATPAGRRTIVLSGRYR